MADQLGTPRMIFDQTGSLANVKRHDYLPFGEELIAAQGGRTVPQGYSGDNVRQLPVFRLPAAPAGATLVAGTLLLASLGRSRRMSGSPSSGNSSTGETCWTTPEGSRRRAKPDSVRFLHER